MQTTAGCAGAITAIEAFLFNQSVEDFLSSDILQAAVERKFEIIGEALKKAVEAVVQSQLPGLKIRLQAVLDERTRE